jgi:predicted nucleotidyltransferase
MIFGLTKDEYLFIQKQIVFPLKELGATVWCFGSRARGDFKKFSDLDILVSSQSAELIKAVGIINETMVESSFPYKVDIVFEDALASSYSEKIFREKVVF